MIYDDPLEAGRIDPLVCIARQRELVHEVLALGYTDSAALLMELAKLCEALDKWRCSGGWGLYK